MVACLLVFGLGLYVTSNKSKVNQHNACSENDIVQAIEQYKKKFLTNETSFEMRSAKLMCMTSFALATGVVIRLSGASTNKYMRKRSSSGLDLDSMK